ncbi:hypothetical protein AKJ16_DCAP04118 [Drosera capensis]
MGNNCLSEVTLDALNGTQALAYSYRSLSTVEMREFEKKKTQNHIQIKRSVRTTPRKDTKQLERNDRKVQSVRETDKRVTNAVVSDKEVGMESSEVSVRNEDAVNVSEGSVEKEYVVSEHNARPVDNSSAALIRETIMVKEEDSDSETATDSVSSLADSVTANEEKAVEPYRVQEKKNEEDADEISAGSHHSNGSLNLKSSPTTAEELMESQQNGRATEDNGDEGALSDGEVPSIKSNSFYQGKTSSELRANDHENNAAAIENEEFPAARAVMNQNIDEMKTKIEKLEEELREVAALEISVYAITPEHGSSAHKVHTPARRLSRLYIHACKHWTQSKRATIARSTVSGLILVARTCGNDVSRLTFWLSNTMVLREIIAQAFGISSQSNATRVSSLNGSGKTIEGYSSSLKFKSRAGSKQAGKKGVIQLAEDWPETSTSALERVESWIFSRIVESVWRQALAPHMQSPSKDLVSTRSVGRLSDTASAEQKPGSYSVHLWSDAFMDAFHRLCPFRAGGHECGCLPVLARMVISQCVARLDVAMFNAILRESEHETPSDPVSDPILDTRALPISAGDLSFGSGAQLKKAVGIWSRCLDDLFGTNGGHPSGTHHAGSGDDDQHDVHARPKYFHLLDEFSDLLMLPKDMLVDRSIRKEVCPSISLSLVKRIACNFTPDEFCPDHVPGEVLEVLNAESILERRSSGDSASRFPYIAAPVVYSPPSTADVAEKVAEAPRGKPHLEHKASMIQTKGYTSDEELEELDSPLSYIVDNLRSSGDNLQSINGSIDNEELMGAFGVNARYKLLREVWSL